MSCLLDIELKQWEELDIESHKVSNCVTQITQFLAGLRIEIFLQYKYPYLVKITSVSAYPFLFERKFNANSVDELRTKVKELFKEYIDIYESSALEYINIIKNKLYNSS